MGTNEPQTAEPGKPANVARETRILDAAAALISRLGYSKTSINDIAAEAGISKGAVYLHFSSKEALFEALILRESERVLVEVARAMTLDPDGGSIYNLYRYSLIGIATNPMLKAVVTRDKRVLGELMRAVTQKPMYQQMRGFGLEFVQQCQAAGLIRADLTPQMVVYTLSIIRYGFFQVDEMLPPEYIPSLEEFGPVLADVVRRMIAPDGGDTQAGRLALDQLIASYRQLRHSKDKKV